MLLGGVAQLLLNQGEQLQLARENAAELFDERHQFAVFSLDLVALQAGELVEAEVEDGHGLALAESVLGHQLHAGLVAVGCGADDLHEVVQIAQGDLEALEDVGAVLGLTEAEAGAAGDHVAAVLDEAFEQLADVHLLRATLVEGEQDDAERVFEVRVLVELVDDDLRVLVALELDDHARVFVGLVAEVGDLIQHLVGAQLGDVLHQGRAIDVVGQLREDDLLLAVLHLLRVGDAADADDATAGTQVLLDAILTIDDAASREVRTDDNLLQVFDGGARLVDDETGRLDELVQVMGRDVSRHADRDAGRTVHQQVRQGAREDGRLGGRLLIIRDKIHRVLVDVGEELGRDLGEAALGVTVGRGRIAVDGAEVALRLDQLVAHHPVLGEADERVVHGAVAVWVIVLQHFADDAGALIKRAVVDEAFPHHRVEDAALHGLQAVTRVREGAGDDDGHRVIDVGRLHDVRDVGGREFFFVRIHCRRGLG